VKDLIGKRVIVRTYSAGVHFGILAKGKGTEVTLTCAKRLWRWRGGNTLHEVSKSGVNRSEYTRISEEVETICLTQAVEIVPLSPEAWATMKESVWN
jgi:hypothetical protein